MAKTQNKSANNIDDNGVATLKEATDHMGGPIYLFEDKGGKWGEHHKNSSEDIITDYFNSDAEADQSFADETEKSVWS